MEKRSRQCEHGQPMEQTRGRLYTCESGVARCQSQHQCHFFANEFDVRNVLHEQVSLAAIIQTYVIHEAMNGLQNLNIYVEFRFLNER